MAATQEKHAARIHYLCLAKAQTEICPSDGIQWLSFSETSVVAVGCYVKKVELLGGGAEGLKRFKIVRRVFNKLDAKKRTHSLNVGDNFGEIVFGRAKEKETLLITGGHIDFWENEKREATADS